MSGVHPADTWLDDGDVRLYHGDALDRLREMPSESVQCIVTSPPFWGLRDYGTGSWTGGNPDCDHSLPPIPHTGLAAAASRADGGSRNTSGTKAAKEPQPFKNTCGKCGARRVDQQIGLEETPDEWCNRLVQVMREARRVLRRDGVAWLECGDTYSSGGRADDGPQNGKQQTNVGSLGRERPAMPAGIKPKDLVGAPWLLAFALRADGWYLRSDTIWARPNPMPESVTDRPTKAHSYVFLLTKSARYFYDADAIREPLMESTLERGYTASKFANGRGQKAEANSDRNDAGEPWTIPSGRNARSVWSIPTEPTPFAHFATFPQALVERCIKAGTSEHGACGECGAPWRRITERETYDLGPANGNAKGVDTSRRDTTRKMSGSAWKRANYQSKEKGWEPSCDHGCPCGHDDAAHATPGTECSAPGCACPHAPYVVPCVVLDMFSGSGTTALVARRLGRHAVGIELNPEYLALAAERLQQLSLLA